MDQREEELRRLEQLAEDLMQILAHPTARVDYLAIAWPVTDETFSPYAEAMYRLMERKRVLLGINVRPQPETE